MRGPFWVGTAIYCGLLLVVGAANVSGPERWWPSAINLYVPQWIWAIPGLGLTLGVALRSPRRLYLPLLAVGYVVVVLMQLPLPSFHPKRQVTGRTLRIMTYNVAQNSNQEAVIREIATANPDLLLLQEAGTLPDVLKGLLPNYHIAPGAGGVVISRYPLSRIEVYPLRAMRYGSALTRCHVQVDDQSIAVYNLHLETSRAGLVELLQHGPGGLSFFRKNVALRVRNAELIANLLRSEPGLVLVGGDFNAPRSSLIYRAIAGAGLTDPFLEAGAGYGYTYGHDSLFRHSYVQLDHLLASRQWQATRCWVGSDIASDHRPVIADLLLAAREGDASVGRANRARALRAAPQSDLGLRGAARGSVAVVETGVM